ncbi:hypothetical protein BDV19DRAFT_256424 [Aspergillus venezuelensis]
MASITIQRARIPALNTRLPLPHLTVTSLLQQSQLCSRSSYRYNSALTLRTYSSKSNKGKNTRPPKLQPVAPSPVNPYPNEVNPPASTRPTELAHVPPRSEHSSLFTWLLAQGRAYLAFYKTGLKNVYYNYRASLEVRRALGIPSYLPTAPDPKYFLKDGGNKTRTSRATFQLVHRAAHDVRRMIPFTLILVVFGEFTPLLVLWLGNAITPFTCRIPKQLNDYREARMKRTAPIMKSFEEMFADRGRKETLEFGSRNQMQMLRSLTRDASPVKDYDSHCMEACVLFGLAKTTNFESLAGPYYRQKLRKYIEYLLLDDKLINEGGGVWALNDEEVRIAVEERGGFGFPDWLSEHEADAVRREWLMWWLTK